MSYRVFQPFVHHLRDRPELESLLPAPPVTAQERVAHGAAIDALSRTVEASGDPALGLHVAAGLERGSMDLLEYLARSCETLGDAIDAVTRYRRLVHDALELELQLKGELAIWTFGVARGLRWHPAAADFLAALFARCFQDMTDGAVVAEAVWLRHPPPSYRAEYAAVVPCEVEFRREVDAVVLSRRALKHPLSTADERLRRVLERQAVQMLDSMPQQQTFTARVVTHIRRAIEAGDPHVGPVARTLGVSPRTLRRRLQDEGTSFGNLLDEVRRDMALDRLAADRSSIPEIATGLGSRESRASTAPSSAGPEPPPPSTASACTDRATVATRAA